ncbi:hypothetical protein [Psychrobacter piscatorii]|uniref:Uncharacterized protein n=1 Tax=Psychrobacter piscatorii TaxID=554343 RepID=A0A0T6DVE3_9GAMM|nr:hypothetical protein [Psychrobacter piscatorii]KRU23517.1 hypothetical protein AS194_03885 [Psychrobacter piscatorii]
MAIVVGRLIAEDCGMGVSTTSQSNLQIGSLETTRCGIGMHIRDDIDNADLKHLLNQIKDLEANSKSERDSTKEAIALINAQIDAPSPIKEFWASLRNIAEGAAGSMLYTTICAFAEPFVKTM